MSQFISVYDVVFGTRTGILGGPNEGFFFKVRPDEPRIALTRVASAIEMCKTYYYDDFGRFGVANDEAKEKIKAALAKYYSEMALTDSDELDELYGRLRDLTNGGDWLSFGWLENDLPDFEACYEQWKSKHNTSGKEPRLQIKRLDNPRKSNTVWGIAEGLIRVVISKYLSSECKTTNDIVAELVSEKNSTETMRLLNQLQHLAPDYFTMDEKTFRTKLKDIFKE